MKNILLLAGGLLFALDGAAAGYTTTQITNNTYPDEYSRINAQGDVIWLAWVNATDPGWTVFKYDAATRTAAPLSANNVFYDSHRMNNRGDAVWMGYDGHDQEIFLYQAAAGTTVQLTNNELDDTAPEISDNGDVSWFEQRGVNVGAFLLRYDAQTKLVSNVDFPGASRQGQHSMNARGDIAWNAEVTVSEVQNGQTVPVTYSQEVLVYTAATGVISNITHSAAAIDSNQHLLDNGDVVWTAYDELSATSALNVYHAATATVTELVASLNSDFQVGALGHVAWSMESTVGPNTVHTVFLYSPASGTVQTIATEVSTYRPILLGVSRRGDVVWRSIIGTDWLSRHYNAATGAVVDLTKTQGFGTYDLLVADNGDAVWSLSDGADYELYSYQADTGVTTQLSNNAVDDGLAAVNADGSIVWNRFDLDDSELILAVKGAAAPELNIDVTVARFSVKTQEAQLKAKFVYDGMPAATDIIGVRFDGATLLNVAFGEFKADRTGAYKYRTGKVSAAIDFKKGLIEVTKQKVDPASINTRDGVDVEIRFGDAVAFDHFGK